MKLYYVYSIGDYAGMSTQPMMRMRNHRAKGRCTKALVLHKVFFTIEEAHDYERWLQTECGYSGVRKRSGESPFVAWNKSDKAREMARERMLTNNPNKRFTDATTVG